MPRLRSCLVTLVGLALPLTALASTPAGDDAAAQATALGYVATHAPDFGAGAADAAELAVVRQYRSQHNGLTHLALRQTLFGLEIDGTEVVLALDRRGAVFHAAGDLLAELSRRADEAMRSPGIGPDEAVIAAARALGLPDVDRLDLVETAAGALDQRVVFVNRRVSEEEIPTRLRYVRTDGDRLSLAWNLSLKAPGDPNWWNVWVHAETGELLRRDNWTADVDTYRVFPSPDESPDNSGGLRSDVVDPWLDGGTLPATGASPYGWHDTNGVLGPEFTDTRGNNVEAQSDIDANNIFGGADVRGNGGTLPDLDFLPALDLALGPDAYREAAVVNLFYWNNVVHDVFYQYGFDEASGNFQQNNYGRGGLGGDPVQADAQDGSGTNNANFSTPADGSDPRMQMYVWNAPQNIHENSPTVRDFPAGAASTDGSWGFNPTSFSVTNDLVFINDGQGDVNDGCCSVSDPTNGRCTGHNWGVTGKIALLRRGTCTFGAKALNAQDAGAVGTIIINNGSNGVAGMAGGTYGPSVTIPTQMIGKDNGNLLVAELGGGPVNVTMSSTAALPNRDSDLDAGVIAHEYGHGLSNRLTGTGPGCLTVVEQAGEGWSDWVTLFMHAESGDTRTSERSVGGYVSFEPVNTAGYIGIRRYPYTTDNTVNPLTYAGVGDTNNSQPHGIGTIWATMLWEAYWNLVDLDGYDPDIYSGTGGNNVAFQLVMDGLKLQPCQPSFVQARDAILAADVADYDGDHECELWRAFAERGLGTAASTGASANDRIVTEDFTLPAQCQANYIFSSSFGHGDTSHWSSVLP